MSLTHAIIVLLLYNCGDMFALNALVMKGNIFSISTSIENRERDLLRTVGTARSSLDLLSKLTGSTSREI